MPDIERSRVVAGAGNRLIVEYVGAFHLLFLSLPVRVRLAVEHEPYRQVRARTEPGNVGTDAPTLASVSSQYRLTPLPPPQGGVRVDYDARFRFGSEGGLAPTGLAIDGEVEDYRVEIISNDPPTLVAPAQLATEEDVPLTVSGHTHGGQINIPFLGPPVLPVFNKTYSNGLKKSPGGTDVFISKGPSGSTSWAHRDRTSSEPRADRDERSTTIGRRTHIWSCDADR